MKKYLKNIKNTFNWLINPKKQRILSADLFANYIILLIALLSFISIIFNYILELYESLYISNSIFLVSVIYFLLNRFSKQFGLIISSGFILLIVAYNIYYIYNYGSQGPMVYFSFLMIYVALYYTKKVFKHLLFAVVLFNISALYYIEFNIPDLIGTYANLDAQLIDHYISLTVTIIAFILLINNLIKTQIEEKKIAQESNHLKSTFLANTSHDLRAPANSILSFSELILEEDLHPKDLEKYINIIHSNSRQLLTLINDIFDISIIESKNLIITPRNININDVLEEVYSNFKREIEVSDKNIELNVHFGLPMTQSIIFADATRIKQILTNLIQNAIKYTNDGAIAFGYDKKLDSNELLFFVKDTGSGIPSDKLNDIFSRYVTNIDTTKKIKGTGLGLHITNSLVKLMHGKIWVESEMDRGSHFFFTLPLITSIE